MLEAKYIIFFAGSIVFIPAGILLASNNRKLHDFVFMFLVFGTCMPESLFGLPTDINFISRQWYRGTTRGMEVSYLDLLAIVLLFSSLTMRRREGHRFFWPPSLGLLLAYFGYCILNVAIFSDPKIFGVFELTKVARGILLFIAVAAYIRSPREIRLFVWALVVTMFYEAAVCLNERYIQGAHRVAGTLIHPNSLSMYSLQCLPIFIAISFAIDASKRLRNACIVASVVAAGCVLLSVSRTGFAALAIVSGGSFILCTKLRMTPRNVSLGLLGIVLATAMIAKSYDTIMSRLGGFDFQREYFSEEGDRGSYFRQAAPAIRDRPIVGVGLNNWSWWISYRYAAEAGYDDFVPYPSMNEPPERLLQAPPAHNLYVLTVTELGWPGLMLLGALLIHWSWITGAGLLRRQNHVVDLFRLGAFLSLGGVLLQSVTEWEFRQTSMFFLCHIIIALGASLYHHQERPRNT